MRAVLAFEIDGRCPGPNQPTDALTAYVAVTFSGLEQEIIGSGLNLCQVDQGQKM